MDPLKKQVILGIDPGTRITGYGIINTDSHLIEPLDFGCIKPPLSLKLEERYLALFNGIEHLIETFLPQAIAVEGQFFYKNVQSAMKVGIVRGMVILAAARKKIPLFEYTPRKAKLAVVGKGGASKEQVQKMIQFLLKLPHMPEPEDAADGLALAICHAHTLRIR